MLKLIIMKKFFQDMFSGTNGQISHKRILGTIGFISLTTTMVINSFSTLDVAPSPELVTSVEWLTMSTIFGTVVEKFSNK